MYVRIRNIPLTALNDRKKKYNENGERPAVGLKSFYKNH